MNNWGCTVISGFQQESAPLGRCMLPLSANHRSALSSVLLNRHGWINWLSELCGDYQRPRLSHVPFSKVTIPVCIVLTYFIFSCFLMFCLCALVHILILHVLSFQNPIYCYPYYSLVYIVGFYLTEYKLVSPSSQSSSKLHRTDSCCTVISLYSLRTIVKVLSTCCSSSSFVVSRHITVVPHHSSSYPVIVAYLHLVGVDLGGQVTLPSTLILPFLC